MYENHSNILLTGGFLSSYAQHHMDQRFVPMVTHEIGGSLQEFDGLNARVAKLPQYEQLRGYAATLGLGWLKERNRVISGGGVTIGSSLSGHKDEKSSTIRYIGLHADVGYDVLKSEKMLFYPLAGLGLQFYQAIFYKDNTEVPFDEVLQSPAVQNSISSARFKNMFFGYRLGLGFSIRAPKYPSYSMGIQAGYAWSFEGRAWRSKEGQSLANAPEDKLSQFFVALVFTSMPKMFRKKD